jgi:nitric oxide reductase large subunit
MEHFNQQILELIAKFLQQNLVGFIFKHSLAFGLFTGIISLLPFLIKRTPHLIILVIGLITTFYIVDDGNLAMNQIIYSAKMYLVTKFIGNYIIGFIFGLALANLVQRIRGDHEDATNNN